ncbi:MAG: hypothetical protein R3202_01270, partial [Candidatus Competibacterales bacterium]|nr:hypothetical protein [Candidatus Competibacterales bacterium]
MVGIDVGHHGQHRLEVEERGIALVGLRHQIAPGAEPGIGTGAVEPAADHEGRVQSALGQQAGDQAGGGGLAVGTGHGDALAEA